MISLGPTETERYTMLISQTHFRVAHSKDIFSSICNLKKNLRVSSFKTHKNKRLKSIFFKSTLIIFLVKKKHHNCFSDIILKAFFSQNFINLMELNK